MKKLLLTITLGILLVFTLNLISAQASYCCEKTTYGAWCQNDVREKCDDSLNIAPTSCESTSYCKRGTCFDSQEGTCMKGTSKQVCENSGGTWADDPSGNIPQCSLGCCLLGDQAALTTLTRCKSLSGFYGLETDFQSGITDELSCIALAGTEEQGACVFEDPATGTLDCEFTTRGKCGGSEGTLNLSTGLSNATTFYSGVLCTAEELGTTCSPSTKTMLVDGRDEVYWQDTCENRGNIYDASKYSDDAYWTYLVKKEDSCGAGVSNANSKDCGNCNYYLGSVAKKAGVGSSPSYGDYICADLNCKDSDGTQYDHGETWCVDGEVQGDVAKVGSKYYKKMCYNGEVIIEPCADFRNEICVEETANEFTEAACVVNRWDQCTLMTEKDKCEDGNERDCRWIEGYFFAAGEQSAQVAISSNPEEEDVDKNTTQGLCVPRYTPGLQFYGSSDLLKTQTQRFGSEEGTNEEKRFGDVGIGTGEVVPTTGLPASEVCSLGDSEINVLFLRKTTVAGGDEDWKCKGEINTQKTDICQYFTYGEEIELTNPEGFGKEMNKICSSLGDCGSKENFIGVSTEEGYAVYYDGKRVAGKGGTEKAGEKVAVGVGANIIKEFIEDLSGGKN